MKKLLSIIFVLICLIGFLVVITKLYVTKSEILSPVAVQRTPKPLDRYAIPNLRNQIWPISKIELGEVISRNSDFRVQKFQFIAESRQVTGLAHIPISASAESPAAVIVQFRGYVDREKYQSGVGTSKSSESYAKAGFVTLAPDFLGYGGSATAAANIFEERLQTYTTALTLLSSLKSLPIVDSTRVGIWGHSNGGQIALTVLTVWSTPLPTTLWAPVSKRFPYSILYYSDDLSDRGKYLRRELAQFELDYDVEKYALRNYLDYIESPILIHQGGSDDSVPQKWNDELVSELQKLKQDVSYYIYPGADHNLTPGWSSVVARDIEFFSRQLNRK